MPSDAINATLLFVTAIGVMLTFWQIRVGVRSQRAAFLKDLYLLLRGDPDVAKAYYLIEYDEFSYDAKFHDSPLEHQIDRLLTVVDLVCEMHAQGSISPREMQFFCYQFRRIAQNIGIQNYLRFLNNLYKDSNLDHKAFGAFQDYAKDQLKL